MLPERAQRIVIALALLLACAGAASGGTIVIADASATIPVGTGTYSVSLLNNSVNLILDGATVDNVGIFSFGYLSPLPSGAVNFDFTLNLDGVDRLLPASFNGTSVVANGPLTYGLSGNTVSVSLDTVLSPGTSGAITAAFRLYSTGTTPEPGELALIASGLAILGGKLLRRRSRA